MFCGISGKPTKNPVLSPVSKCIFEKELIEQYVQTEGKDPITNSPLGLDQLIELSHTPQQASLVNTLNSSTLNSNYSIPNLLSSLQNEWDALMLENFRLRKQLDTYSKQLSTAFYERDAAKIVAAKAMKEREQVVSEMNKLTIQLGAELESDNEKNDSVEMLPNAIQEELLDESRKYVDQTRKVPDKFTILNDTKFELKKTWDVPANAVINRTSKLLANPQRKSAFQLLEAGAVVIVEDFITRQIQTNFTDDLEYFSLGPASDVLLCSFGKQSVGIYNIESGSLAKLDMPHNKIILMAQHEYILNKYFLVVEENGRVLYCLLDCSKAYEVLQGHSEKKYNSASLHKDGLLIALVQADSIELFNLGQPNSKPTVFKVGKQIIGSGIIENVEFSSNGYWMIVSCGGSIMSFDLRKEPGTLAVNSLSIATSKGASRAWDMDMSAKDLLVVENESVEELELNLKVYKYKKAKKIWESVPDRSGNLVISGLKNKESLQQIQLIYDDSSISILLRTEGQISLYSTAK
ncbi:hypothetical protein HG535_0H03850 [Zygotorulaspora mrakii]|uniref:Pre-mRNA-processing factor 19 n=1 Tax=Zygotorulaspora mrakii TaxID=42260 RepID=A0A7H9B8G8_ZYGMR|nr:uncharacterized protein HG535_0H03850 [Zygotorulaspora mrakii]QLG75058.1 hypothetical protein HG535_0H03850 [Zygotorulaspora mrakii]